MTLPLALSQDHPSQDHSAQDISLKHLPTALTADHAEFQLEGAVGERIRLVTQQWLLKADDANPAMLGMIAERNAGRPRQDLLPWSGEFAGKYLTALAEVLRVGRDPQLLAHGQRFVARLIALQDAEGYIGTFAKGSELSGKGQGYPDGGTWDLWNTYHIMLGLLRWQEATGDATALAAARRVGDLLCTRFAGAGRRLTAAGSCEMNLAPVHALAILYRRTGEQRYLAQAEEIVREFADAGAGDYLRTGLQGVEFFQTPKPRWESLHPLMGLAELHGITGNESYRTAFEHHWRSIRKLDRHNNGGFSSGEQAHGDPYHLGAIETCCTIAWMALSVEMLHLTADPTVADELEWSLLNQVMGCTTPQGDGCTYNTPMNGRRTLSTVDIAFQIRPGSEQLNCCSVNAARGFGLLGDWALMSDRAGALFVNFYGAGTMSAHLGTTRVTVAQQTGYPRDGRIELRISPERTTRFPLKLRIPHWSAQTRATVNGTAVSATAGTYLTIERAWQAGDRVTLDLDFTPRCWAGERDLVDKASLYRGPLLLAYEAPSQDSRMLFSAGWERFGALHANQRTTATVEYTFVGDRITWVGFGYDDAGITSVTIDGKDVATVDQYRDGRDIPFTWKTTGLGAGNHRIRIAATGRKNPASKGTWINLSGFADEDGLPRLDATRLGLAVAGGSQPQNGLLLTARDVNGNQIQLRDYASAGWNGTEYSTWLPIGHVTPAAFSNVNPSRTSQTR